MRFGVVHDESSSSSDDERHVLPSSPPLARRSPIASRRPLPPSSKPTKGSRAFSPSPVQFVNPPKPSRAAKHFRSRVVPLSDDDDESDASERDSPPGIDSAVLSGSDSDSEEELWPVGPRRTAQARLAPLEGKAFAGLDPFDKWNEHAKQTSWTQANRSFHLSLARSLSASPPPRPASTTTASDMASIQSLLSDLKLQQANEASKLVQSFETRNKALWTSIEAAIKQAEHEEGERQRVLEEKRKQQEEAERKAKEMREAEQKKAADERKKQEQERLAREQKDAEEKQAREQAEKKLAEAQQQAQRTASVVSVPTGSSVAGSPQADYERWAAVMLRIKQQVLPTVSQNTDWRKQCFTAKRSITPKIGQLTASSETTLRIINQLDQILSSMRPPPGSGGPTEPYTWTLNHLSKALVKQAETEVTAKLSTAYPLGRVVIGLLVRGHIELGDVLMARLVKKCFWITGWWPPKRPEQSEQDHRKTLGHAAPTSGETIVQYAQRMSGILALYASILQTSPLKSPQGPCPQDRVSNVPDHFRPKAGWRWLVIILTKPLVSLEPTPLLVITFLEIAAQTLRQTYGKQFDKFLEVLSREGLKEGKAEFSDKAKSSSVRLSLWLEDWEKTGQVESATGREPDP
ncbi:Nuclear pore complex nucleoporin component [Microbotryomycetes sp. JL201]|nr:Nuclear pore complex nucleoporin component [Microbotryomycetes sp. JL201]